MKKIIFGVLLIAGVIGVSQLVHATDLSIENNGAGSKNSVSVNDTSNTTVHQGQSAEITNDQTSKASTGDNKTDGNNGNQNVTTGDATSTNTVNNTFNTNYTETTCPTCTNPTTNPTAQPTTKPTSGPNPTNTPGPNNSSPPTTDNHSSQGGIGGGDVLGLSATSGMDVVSLASTLTGVLCLGLGSVLFTYKKRV